MFMPCKDLRVWPYLKFCTWSLSLGIKKISKNWQGVARRCNCNGWQTGDSPFMEESKILCCFCLTKQKAERGYDWCL